MVRENKEMAFSREKTMFCEAVVDYGQKYIFDNSQMELCEISILNLKEFFYNSLNFAGIRSDASLQIYYPIIDRILQKCSQDNRKYVKINEIYNLVLKEDIDNYNQ